MKTLTGMIIWIGLIGPLSGGEASSKPSDEIVPLPRFVVVGDAPVYGLSWRCKWPTQKSKIAHAWFTNIPPGGAMEKAGVRKDDALLIVDGFTLADMTGEWMSARLKQAWKASDAHEFVFERQGKKYRITVETKPKPNPTTTEPTPSTTKP